MSKSMTRKPVASPLPCVGLDLAADSASACVLDVYGTVIARLNMTLDRDALVTAFSGELEFVVLLEASTPARWVKELLESLGHEVLVCNPRRLKMVAASKFKTDKLDAEVLARLARSAQMDGEFVHGVEVRSRETQLKRTVLSTRGQFIGMRTALINRLRGALRGDAFKPPSCSPQRFAAAVEEMELPEDLRDVITPTLALLKETEKQLAELDRRISAFRKELPVIEKLQEVPGVGVLTATAFALTVEDPARFESSRDIGPYLGLVPGVRSSGTQELRGACTKQGDQRMRTYLVQAALCLLRTKEDSALKRWGLAVCERRGRKKGIVAIARKLAVVMMAMWRRGEDYRRWPGEPHVAPVAKARRKAVRPAA